MSKHTRPPNSHQLRSEHFSVSSPRFLSLYLSIFSVYHSVMLKHMLMGTSGSLRTFIKKEHKPLILIASIQFSHFSVFGVCRLSSLISAHTSGVRNDYDVVPLHCIRHYSRFRLNMMIRSANRKHIISGHVKLTMMLPSKCKRSFYHNNNI